MTLSGSPAAQPARRVFAQPHRPLPDLTCVSLRPRTAPIVVLPMHPLRPPLRIPKSGHRALYSARRPCPARSKHGRLHPLLLLEGTVPPSARPGEPGLCDRAVVPRLQHIAAPRILLRERPFGARCRGPARRHCSNSSPQSPYHTALLACPGYERRRPTRCRALRGAPKRADRTLSARLSAALPSAEPQDVLGREAGAFHPNALRGWIEAERGAAGHSRP